jgi:hypothetical protein
MHNRRAADFPLPRKLFLVRLGIVTLSLPFPLAVASGREKFKKVPKNSLRVKTSRF